MCLAIYFFIGRGKHCRLNVVLLDQVDNLWKCLESFDLPPWWTLPYPIMPSRAFVYTNHVHKEDTIIIILWKDSSLLNVKQGHTKLSWCWEILHRLYVVSKHTSSTHRQVGEMDPNQWKRQNLHQCQVRHKRSLML